MNSETSKLAALASAIAIASVDTAQAHSGAEMGPLAAMLHGWSHAAPLAGLLLAVAAMTGIILVIRKRPSRR